MASGTVTVAKEARQSGLTRNVSQDSLVRSSAMLPLLGAHPNMGSYLGRVVIEVWEPADAAISDGLVYLAAPAASLSADELLRLAKTKLSKRS